LGSVELGLFLRKFVFQREQSEKFSSRTILKNEVQFFFILKALFKFDKKRMLQVTKDAFFSHDIFLLIFFNDVFLLQHLHSIDLFI